MNKKLLILLLLAFSHTVLAQEFFSGKVDAVELHGERIVIDGGEYRITGNVIVMVGEHKVGLENIKQGSLIQYALDYRSSGAKLVKAVKLQISEEELAEILNH